MVGRNCCFAIIAFSTVMVLDAPARGDLVQFDLRGTEGAALDDLAFGSVVNGGITATLTANIGTMNKTTKGFGINAPETTDTTYTLDAGSGTSESITLGFDREVLLNQIVLSILSTGEQATLTIPGQSPMTLTDTGTGTDIFNFTSNNLVRTGESVVLSHSSGNGFSFDSFSVTATPEPRTAVMLGVVSVILSLSMLWRRDRRSQFSDPTSCGS